MLELSKKEWGCFYEYLNDFIKIFDEENDLVIWDNKYTYTRKELVVLKNKILKNIENHT